MAQLMTPQRAPLAASHDLLYSSDVAFARPPGGQFRVVALALIEASRKRDSRRVSSVAARHCCLSRALRPCAAKIPSFALERHRAALCSVSFKRLPSKAFTSA